MQNRYVLTLLICAFSLVIRGQDSLKNFYAVNQLLPSEDGRTPLSYCDKGAWFNFGLPTSESDTLGFPGPWLVGLGADRYFSDHFGGMLIVDTLGNTLKAVDALSNISSQHGYGLTQEVSWPSVVGKSELTYVDVRTALMRYSITNTGSEIAFFTPAIVGSCQDTTTQIQNDALGIFVNIQRGERIIKLFPEGYYRLLTTRSDSSFSHDWGRVTLQPGESWSKLLVVQVKFKREKVAVPKVGELASVFDENREQWLNMIAPYAEKYREHPEYLNLAAKCISTLLANWKSPAGDLKHDGIFPSHYETYFQGFWAWDSWKHAVALARIDPELAKNQVRAMFDFQNEEGMVADCIFRDPTVEAHNWDNTKPPLATWAVKTIYDETGDVDFVKEMMPKLLKYHQWWDKRRNFDRNALFAYGSENGSKTTALWESGMDNAVRFDFAGYSTYPPGSYGSLSIKGVDINCYLYWEEQELKKLIKSCGLKHEFSLSPLFDESPVDQFYSENDAFFFDLQQLKGYIPSFTKIKGPECWTPLFTGLANEDQAQTVMEVMMDESQFNTYVPFPSISAHHVKFQPEKGYWRGPVWLDQAYFAIKGMRNYGRNDWADQMTIKLLSHCEGVLNSDAPLRENYNPLTGEGLNAQYFSWTASSILLLLNDLNPNAIVGPANSSTDD